MIYSLAVYIRKLALVFFLGMMLFFSAIVAPTVFKTLPRDMAALLQSALFPLYYKAGIVCSVLMGLTWLIKSPRQFRNAKWVSSLLLTLVCAIVFAFCLWVLTPKLGDLRAQMSSTTDLNLQETLKGEFAWFHKISVFLNFVVILFLMILLALI